MNVKGFGLIFNALEISEWMNVIERSCVLFLMNITVKLIMIINLLLSCELNQY